MGRYEGTDVFLGRRDHGSGHSAVAEVNRWLPMTRGTWGMDQGAIVLYKPIVRAEISVWVL